MHLENNRMDRAASRPLRSLAPRPATAWASGPSRVGSWGGLLEGPECGCDQAQLHLIFAPLGERSRRLLLQMYPLPIDC